MKLFRMEIAPEKKLIRVALGAIREVVEQFFDDSMDKHSVVLDCEEAINNLLEYCDAESLTKVTLEVETKEAELVINIYDDGLPAILDEHLQDEHALGLHLMRKLMDKVIIENLGEDGRCQRMYKQLSRMPEYEKRNFEIENIGADTKFEIRRPEDNEFIHIARCFYDEYGLDYPGTIYYYPDRVAKANREGDIHSLVAVSEEGEIAAHMALNNSFYLPGMWDISGFIVHRKFRNAGLISRLLYKLMEDGRNIVDADTFVSEAVLYHPYTQKVLNKVDVHPCAIAFSLDIVSHTEGIDLDEGSTCGEAFLINHDHGGTMYISQEIKPLIDIAVRNVSIDRTIEAIPEGMQPEPEEEYSVIESSMNSLMELATIIVKKSGKDFARQLNNLVIRFKKENIRTIVLFINVNEPGAVQCYEDAKSVEFFCTGLMPQSGYGDMICMQRLMNTVVGYDKLVLTEEYAELVAEVRKLDPHERFKEEY